MSEIQRYKKTETMDDLGLINQSITVYGKHVEDKYIKKILIANFFFYNATIKF
jgi:hypothetical protein